MSAEQLLERLKDASDGGPADRLAGVLMEQLLATRADALIAPEALAKGAREALDGWLSSKEALATLEGTVEAAVAALQASRRAVRDGVAPPIADALLELCARPYSPDRKVVLAVIDRAPMRALVRELVLDTVTAFGQRMAAPAASVTKGLGGLARFAAEQVKQRGGPVGTLVGAVSNEVQSQLQKRAADFADVAISSVVNEIADAISDPKRAAEAAQLRVEALRGALELTAQQLSNELINLDVPGGAEVLRAGLRKWAASPAGEAAFARLAKPMLEQKTVGELLDGIGQRGAAMTLGRALLRPRLMELFQSPAYATWLTELMKG